MKQQKAYSTTSLYQMVQRVADLGPQVLGWWARGGFLKYIILLLNRFFGDDSHLTTTSNLHNGISMAEAPRDGIGMR